MSIRGCLNKLYYVHRAKHWEAMKNHVFKHMWEHREMFRVMYSKKKKKFPLWLCGFPGQNSSFSNCSGNKNLRKNQRKFLSVPAYIRTPIFKIHMIVFQTCIYIYTQTKWVWLFPGGSIILNFYFLIYMSLCVLKRACFTFNTWKKKAILK